MGWATSPTMLGEVAEELIQGVHDLDGFRSSSEKSSVEGKVRLVRRERPPLLDDLGYLGGDVPQSTTSAPRRSNLSWRSQ
jgi:hypothetical protein